MDSREYSSCNGIWRTLFYWSRQRNLVNDKEDFIATKIVEINIHKTIITSFPVLDIFINVAAHFKKRFSRSDR